MNRRGFVLVFALLAGVMLLVGSAVSAAPLPQAQPLAVSISGTLNIVSGDQEGFVGTPVEHYSVVDALGNTTTLLIDPELRETLDLYRLSGKQITVIGNPAGNRLSPDAQAVGEAAAIQVDAIESGPESREATATSVTGNTKWISIACKFADIADEPKPRSYFQNMYANAYPGLDAYWREASYDNINLAGSTAAGWFTLPKPMSDYQIDANNIKLTDLFMDCAAQADPVVNFNDYLGVNLMLNGNPGCCAWGGNRTVTLDGITRNWKVTWLPPWSYEQLGYIQHEMTHGYGILWHSYANDNAYGDYWDVVSNAVAGDPHQVYGRIGQHTQAYHRDYLGWLPASRVLTVGQGTTTFMLARTTQPPAGGYLMAKVPINGSISHYYALEARQQVGYDSNLWNDSITIHEIGGPRHSVQLIDPMAIGQKYGSYAWKVGQTWAAPEGGVTVHIDNASTSGFEVTVRTGLETHTLSIPLVEDTYVDEVAPQTNFGASPLLRTQGSLSTGCENNELVHCKVAFLRFDSQPLPPNIARAWLRLTHTNDPISGYLSVNYQGANPAWGEMDLTWDSVPDEAFTTIWVPYLHTPTASGSDWKAWDLSGMLTILGPRILESLTVDNGTFTFSSREGPNPPQLVVEYLVEPGNIPSQTLHPTDDTYARQAMPTTIYGNKSVLNVMNAANDQNSYVKFNLSDLPATPLAATLRLYVTNPGPDGGGVYAVDSTYPGQTTQWTEASLKWSNAPAIGGTALGQIGQAANGKWVEVDVTTAAQAAMGNNGRLNLGIRNNSNDLVAYSSKEGAFPPELLVEFGGSEPPEPEMLTFAPTNDAYVRQAYVKTVYGTKPTLRVQNAAKDTNTYVKFNVASLTGVVDSAVLRLYVTDPGPDGGSVYRVSTSYPGASTQWLETGLKWNNAPVIDSSAIGNIGNAPDNKWVEVDVTEAVTYALANENGRVSLALRNNSSNLVVYSSKEGAHPPELVITTE